MSEPDMAAWPHVFVPGDGPVLLMLHGTGSNEQQILALGQQLDPSAAFLAPRGRVSENGAARWFRRLAEGVFDVDDVIAQADALAGFVEWARAEYRLDARPLIAVGFSNGANMGLALAGLHPETVQHAVAFSGMYPLGDRDIPGAVDLVETSVLLLNGDADAMAPTPSVDRLAAQLNSRGATVQRETRAGGHGVTPGELAAAHGWLRAAFPQE